VLLTDIDANAAQKDRTIMSLESKISALENQNAEQAVVIETSAEQAEQKDRTIISLESKISALEAINVEQAVVIETNVEQIETIISDNSDQAQRLIELESTVLELRAINTELQLSGSEKDVLLTDIEANAAQKDKTIMSLESRISALENQNAEQALAIETNVEQAEEKDRTIISLKSELRYLEAINADQAEDIDNLKNENAVVIDYLKTTEYVAIILELFVNNFHSLELTGSGVYDDNTSYTVYQIGDNSIKITVSIDENNTRYIIGNVNSTETMQKAINILTEIFTEPIPYLYAAENKSIFEAVFIDSDNLYINNNSPDYVGTFTILGSQIFIEEVTTQDRIIVQKQWSTPEYFNMCKEELGEGFGFIALWDNEI
jgi:uncharacterized coiled-coil protein SlyX